MQPPTPNPQLSNAERAASGNHHDGAGLLVIRDDCGRSHPLRLGMMPWKEVYDASDLGENPSGGLSVLTEAVTGGFLLVGMFAWGLGPWIADLLRIPRLLGYMAAIVLSIVVCAAIVVFWRLCNARLVGLRGRGNARGSLAVAHHVRTRIARDRACPVCGYPIEDLATERDGCTVCAECGSAWRVDQWAVDAGIYKPPAVYPTLHGPDGLLAVRDARGVRVPMLASGPKRARMDAVRGMQARVPARVRRCRIAGVLIWLGGTGAVAAFLVSLNGFGSFIAKVYTVGTTAFVGVLLVGVCLLGVRAAIFGVLKPVLVQETVSKGRCPCCEIPLRDTPSPIDGCLLCDACGSAWNPVVSESNDFGERYRSRPKQ